MNPNLDIFLARLDRGRQLQAGRWTARCPAHEDRTPSLSITDQEGVILVRCFAGCGFHDIVAAVGMEPADFFPPRADHHAPIPASQRWIPRQTLTSIAHELTIVVLAAGQIDRGQGLSEMDRQRLARAAGVISQALREAGIHE
jgi:hypothetical protein